MKEEDKYQLVVLDSLLKEYELDHFVCLFDVAEETVCVELLRDNNLLVSDYERGVRRKSKVYYNVYDAVLEVFDRISDSFELQAELISKFNECIGKEMEKGL